MKPLVLKMQAFGSYGDETVIDFGKVEQNLFLVTGDTGAGKSTIFDALTFALYGEVSSGSSKKSGLDLQSHFATTSLNPYVELTFIEKNQEYKVYRSPAHMRKKKKKGEGDKQESEKVFFTLPNQEELTGASANRKLIEILGLTKAQFMQVAMIAQGEFMEMLRAKSDKKKEIFRKLFRTEFYEKLTEKLGKEDSKSKKEREEISLIWKNKISQVFLSDYYGEKEEMKRAMDSILAASTAIPAQMDDFLQRLNDLNNTLSVELKEKEEKKSRISELRDKKRDEHKEGLALLKAFEDYEASSKEVSNLKEKEENIDNLKSLFLKITKAFEIYPSFEVFQNLDKEKMKMEEELSREKENEPRLQLLVKEAGEKEEVAKKEEKSAIESYTILQQKTEIELSNFKKRAEVQHKLSLSRRAEKAAEEKKEAVSLEIDRIISREKEGKAEVERLPQLEARLVELRGEYEKLEGLNGELQELKRLTGEITELENQLSKERDTYLVGREKYERKRSVYEDNRRAFLDEQAGFLASTKLFEGEPCPVCGSKTHPSPCKLKEELSHFSREEIDELEKEVNQLKREQEEKANMLSAMQAAVVEKKIYLEKVAGKIREELLQVVEIEIKSMEKMNELLLKEKNRVTLEGKKAKFEKDKIEELKIELLKAEKKKEELLQEKAKLEKEIISLKESISGLEVKLSELSSSVHYEKVEDILEPLNEVKKLRKEKEEIYKKAEKALEELKREKNRCDTLIARLSVELPLKEEKVRESRERYLSSLSLSSFSEEELVSVVACHKKEEINGLQEKIADFEKKKVEAVARLLERKEKIRGKEKPDISALLERANEADLALKTISDEFSRFSSSYQRNLTIYSELYGALSKDRAKVEKSAMIHELAERFKGNLTNKRMDIETFVQRYYLKRILHLANKRLMPMTGNQYEMRIFSEEEANQGSNKGLDLNIYSYLTGQEREIRTLSGGESFMAALALALGISDQIQEHTSAIMLDIMFVDEGFGSLDDHARNQSIRVLKEMAGEKRLIGIISHVNELKREIDEQLVVTKGDRGSEARWRS